MLQGLQQQCAYGGKSQLCLSGDCARIAEFKDRGNNQMLHWISNYQQQDIRLFFEQNSHQLGFVAHHIHLCFQARMSDESLLAHPRP